MVTNILLLFVWTFVAETKTTSLLVWGMVQSSSLFMRCLEKHLLYPGSLSKDFQTRDQCHLLGGKLSCHCYCDLFMPVSDTFVFYSGLILFSLTCGLLLSFHSNIAQSWWWSVLGASSSMGLMLLQRWNAYACGQ